VLPRGHAVYWNSQVLQVPEAMKYKESEAHRSEDNAYEQTATSGSQLYPDHLGNCKKLNMMEDLKEQSFGVPASTVSFWPMKQQQSGGTWQLHARGPTSPVFTTNKSSSPGFSPQIHTAFVPSKHGSHNMGLQWAAQSTDPCMVQTPSPHLSTRLTNGTDSSDHMVGSNLDFPGKKWKRLSVQWAARSTDPCMVQTPSPHLSTRLTNGTDSSDHMVGSKLDFPGKKIKSLSVHRDK